MENSPPFENPLVIGHPALREISTPVADGSEIPDNLIRTMNWIAMEDKRKKMNLVPALSAPQLGINKRIIGTGFTMDISFSDVVVQFWSSSNILKLDQNCNLTRDQEFRTEI